MLKIDQIVRQRKKDIKAEYLHTKVRSGSSMPPGERAKNKRDRDGDKYWNANKGAIRVNISRKGIHDARHEYRHRIVEEEEDGKWVSLSSGGNTRYPFSLLQRRKIPMPSSPSPHYHFTTCNVDVEC